MDHPFRTQRPALEHAREGLRLASDVLAVSGMSDEDRARMMQRREPEVADAAAREALARRAGRLGLLLADLDAACAGAGAAGEPLFEIFERPWAAFVSRGDGGAALDGLRARLEQAARDLRARRDALALVEEDDGDASSSYSDYSDSETASTESEDGGEEDDDDETGEGSSEPATSPAAADGPAAAAAAAGGGGAREGTRDSRDLQAPIFDAH